MLSCGVSRIDGLPPRLYPYKMTPFAVSDHSSTSRGLRSAQAWRCWGEKLQLHLRSLCVYSPPSAMHPHACAAVWPALGPADCCDSSLINGRFEMKMIYSTEVRGGLQSWLTVSTGQEPCWSDVVHISLNARLRDKATVKVHLNSTISVWGWAADFNLKLNRDHRHLPVPHQLDGNVCFVVRMRLLIDAPLIHSLPVDDKPKRIAAGIFTRALIILKHQ